MGSEAFTLAILLTLKDAASSGLDRFEAKLLAGGKAGEKFAADYQKLRSQLNKDLAIGGVGLAGLKLMKNGIDAAADYQSVMSMLGGTQTILPFPLETASVASLQTKMAGGSLTSEQLVKAELTRIALSNANGPAIMVGGWALQQLWLFWVAPIAGALLAASAYAMAWAEDAQPVIAVKAVAARRTAKTAV